MEEKRNVIKIVRDLLKKQEDNWNKSGRMVELSN